MGNSGRRRPLWLSRLSLLDGLLTLSLADPRHRPRGARPVVR